MNFNSLITRVSTIFIITIVLFIINFFGYFQYKKVQKKNYINQTYLEISKHIHENRLNGHEVIEYTKNKNFNIIREPEKIINDTKLVVSGPGYEALKKDDSYYINIHNRDFRLLLKDSNKYKDDFFGLILLGVTLIILIITFIWIISALKPLKELKEEIRRFAKGDLDINCKSDKKDEIAQLGNEFDNAAKKISLLLESRQLFLRTIMHELKTPIAKGRIVSELIEDEKQKNRIIQIFEKLNLQIDDFARIEEIISENYDIKKQKLYFNEVLNHAIELMMLDKVDDKIIVETITNDRINADLDLLSLTFKNLIDNALKYSIDKKVLIKKEDNYLLFISKGKKLEKPIEDYFKPFHNDTKKKNHGMGLGLYIVNYILKLHKMKFYYEYKDEKNIFKIGF